MYRQAQQKQAKDDVQSAAFSEHGGKNADVPVEIPRYFYPIFFSMSILALAAAFTTTSVTVSLATIAGHFRLSTPQAFWLGTSTALTATVVQPGCACFADIIGRRAALTFSAAILALGGLLAAVAQNYATIITGRSLQGIGVGGIYAITEIIVTDLVPLRLRGIWLGFLSISSAIGTCSGPILSGVLTKTASWRWIFGISVLTTVVAMIACFISLPSSYRDSNTMDQLRRVDFFGFGLLAASLVCFLVPLMQAGVVYPWTDVKTLLPLIAGLVGILMFLVFEHRFAKFPLVPLARFCNRTCLLAFTCSCAHGLVLWCLMYYVPIYYEFVKGFDTLKTGVAMLPELLTISFGAAAAGYLVSLTGKYRWMIWQGWATSAVGMGLLPLLSEKSSTASWICLNIPVGIGMGILFGSLQIAVQASIDPDELPIAVTLFIFFRTFGAALGISIGGAIFSSEMSSDPLSGRDVALVVGAKSERSSVIQSRSALDIVSMGMKAKLFGLRKIWVFCGILCVVMLLASLAIKAFPIDNKDEKQERRCGDGCNDEE